MSEINQNGNKKRVVVAMSGGVDSSVAALLVEQGYDIVGMMIGLWSEPGMNPTAPANHC